MKRIALAAALATTALAAPAFADGHAASFAIMHFNMDADNPGDLRMVPMGDGPMVVDLAPGSTLADVFQHLNMDADNAADLRGTNGVTILTSQPEHAAEIFRMLREAEMDGGN